MAKRRLVTQTEERSFNRAGSDHFRKSDEAHYQRRHGPASIGPEVITSGNPRVVPVPAGRGPASIGPEVITSGNRTPGVPSAWAVEGFNRAGSDHFRKCRR